MHLKPVLTPVTAGIMVSVQDTGDTGSAGIRESKKIELTYR